MTTHDVSVLFDQIHSYIRGQVAAGFANADAIVVSALDVFGEEADPAFLRQPVRHSVHEFIAEHLAEQETWPAITDCDRLDAAFAVLERDGILCRQHYCCCGMCGATEIWDELSAAQEAGLPVRGYAFYHGEDTEAAIEGDGLHLNYGALDGGEEESLAVARAIIARLEQHGLHTSWDGQWSSRIGILMDWKRRSSAVCPQMYHARAA